MTMGGRKSVNKLRSRDQFRRLTPRFKSEAGAIAYVTHGHPNATYRIVPVEDAPKKEGTRS